MNILLIAPYRTYSGWGEGSKNLAKALHTLDHNLAIRPIYMSNEIDREFDDEELLELEKAQYDKYDVIIQRVLPNIFRRSPNVKNVLACVFETSNIHTTPWWRHLNLTDAILVPSKQEKINLLDDGIKSKVYNVSEAIDISKYDKEYEQLPELKDTFNFYFIGELIERKNLKALLMAFHREFRPNEPVNLVIKTSGDPQQVYNKIIEIKSNLRIYQSLDKYKKEVVICGYLSQKDLHNLHRSCHCLVMPSYGEAYCRPVVDALGYGNTPIVTNNTGMTDYITPLNGYIVPSRLEPVYTAQPPISNIYTTKENWANINILDLIDSMRHAYQAHKSGISKQSRPDIQQFSYENIGQKLQRALDDITS